MSDKTAAPESPALELIGVDKRFGANHAVRDVSLSVRRGDIHAVIGENGAGKSTLMNLAYGYLPADRGAVRVFGRPVRIHRPADAIAAGLGMVHQHFMLVDAFDAVENLLLGAEGGALLTGGRRAARAALDRLAADYGLVIEQGVAAGEMSVSSRQRLEIAKALFRGAEILILDEPTAVLTPLESEGLFALLRALRAEGKTVIVITHKLKEVVAHADRATVMHRGRVVADLPVAGTAVDELARLMVGRDAALELDKPVAASIATPVILAVEGLQVADDAGRLRVRGVDLTVRAGEIVGVAGVAGSGQSELLEALAGMRAPCAGRALLNGAELTAAGLGEGASEGAAASRARRLGLAHAPEDRLRVGLVGEFPAYEASILGRQDAAAWGTGWRLRWDAVRRRCAEMMAAYDVRPVAPDLPAARFSGGNQQKLVLAREIDAAPALLLAGQPTRGVDIGAAAFIHRRLLALRAAGKAVLLVSADLDEILALSDRVLVMFDGRIVGETTPAAADDRTLGLMMAGAA